MANGTASAAAVKAFPKTYSCPLCGQRILDKAKYNEVLSKMRTDAEGQAKRIVEAERRKHDAAIHQLKERERKHSDFSLSKQKSSFERVIGDLRRDVKEQQRKSDERLKQERRRLERSHAANVQDEIRGAVRKREGELNKLSKANGKLLNRVEQLEKDKNRAYKDGQKDSELKGQRQVIDLRQRLDELQRKLERQTSEERGDISEEKTLAVLQQNFKADEFTRIKKGESGADILHAVKHKAKPVGKIVYEVKDVQGWSNAFITKSSTYKERYQTPHVILVTNAFPKGEKYYAIRSGTHVVHPRLVIYIAGVIRSGIIELSASRLSEKGKNAKMSTLYSYLRSEEFKQKVGAVYVSTTALEDLLKSEKDEHQRRWTKQSGQYDKLRQNVVAIEEKIRSVIEG